MAKIVKMAAKVVKRFGSINHLMDDLENEIEAIKNGNLSEAKARVIAKNRQMQIQAVELILAAARIESRFRPALGERLGITLPAIKEATNSLQ